MSSCLFTLPIDWAVESTINQQRTGIRWNLCSSLKDLIYADDWSLSQCKKDKSINKQHPDTATYCYQQSLTRVRQQVHLPGQHHQSPRRCRRRHQSTIGKSQVSICKSTAALEIISILPKDQQDTNSNVLSVVLYGSECWCMTQQDTNSNVLSVVLYGSECWCMTQQDTNSNVLSVVLYGSECWCMTQQDTNSNVLSVVLYGSECWCMTQQDTNSNVLSVVLYSSECWRMT